MKIIYFAWLREKTGVSEEEADPPESVSTGEELMDWLKQRGGGYAEALDDLTVVRIAVNQELTDLDAAIAVGDEVALFPPMTGG